ncbi:LexA/Signal peptidase [Trametes versicolor FP-101664 SS1]|uniref:LexA/Signal peptidase n=1 Tax=Trametes versicolor (strain FP-101664) TaxID=717944 RepID=UPI0004623D27|nr:LexA/Signal peptidase [Trametes versicolor FP-101664 SS1]EIW61263.1 LexA/Signal peptidase [Trametes versicolor FP-101664 SS1]
MQALRGVRARLTSIRQVSPTVFARGSPFRWTVSALVWLPLAIFVTEYGVNVKVIVGRSMQPALNPDDSTSKDIALFDCFSIRFAQNFNRGDIVALQSPSDSKRIVKRIVALEGDIVRTLPPYPDAEVRVPPGHAWVEGDEPFHTEDSNHFGPVPLGLVESRLAYILWPWKRFGPLGAPLVRRHDAPIGSPDWRRGKAELERTQWRSSRVTVAPPPIEPPATVEHGT